MKLKILFLVYIAGITQISCQNKMNENNKFEWSGAVSAPKSYPAEVYSGHLITGKTKDAYAYLPYNRIVESGLASPIHSTTESIGVAPNALDITWISYVENKNYKGNFKLDTDKINALMAKGNDRPAYDEETKKVKKVTDYAFDINVALIPGGVVFLYVSGTTTRTLVGRFQADLETKEVNWKDSYPQMKSNKEMDEVVAEAVARLPKEVQDQVANNSIPFGYWDSLLKTHPITFAVTPEQKVESLQVNYSNGELETIFLEYSKISEEKNRAIPSEVKLEWRDTGNRRMETLVTIDSEKLRKFLTEFGDAKIKFDFTIDTTTKPKDTKGLRFKMEADGKQLPLDEYIISQKSFLKSQQY